MRLNRRRDGPGGRGSKHSGPNDSDAASRPQVAKRTVLQGLMQQLDRVAARVDEIDAEKDLLSFSEGTTDFWAAARGARPAKMDASAIAATPSRTCTHRLC